MRILLAVCLGVLLLVGAAVAYLTLTGPDQERPTAPKVTQKAKDLPETEPESPSENQSVGVNFKIAEAPLGEYNVRVDAVTYADLSGNTQSTTVTVTGTIVDKLHPIKFWQAPKRFQLLNKIGQPFPAKTTIKKTGTGLLYTSVYSKVSVQSLRDKDIYLAIAPAPRLKQTVYPLVLGITPDRFRFGS